MAVATELAQTIIDPKAYSLRDPVDPCALADLMLAAASRAAVDVVTLRADDAGYVVEVVAEGRAMTTLGAVARGSPAVPTRSSPRKSRGRWGHSWAAPKSASSATAR